MEEKELEEKQKREEVVKERGNSSHMQNKYNFYTSAFHLHAAVTDRRVWADTGNCEML